VYGRRHRNGLADETPVRNLSPQFSVSFHASCGNAKVGAINMLSDGQHHLHHHGPSPCRNQADPSATKRTPSLAKAAAQINMMALQ